MAQDTNIEWTDKSWNFLRGCSRVSEGCRNCYAERTAIRFAKPGEAYHGLVQSTPGGPKWTGKVEFFEHILLEPLKWRKPCRVFVNSMSDLFHENVTDEMLDKAFAVMALTPQHTYQILTKRPERMREYFANPFDRLDAIGSACKASFGKTLIGDPVGLCSIPDSVYVDELPLPNVWLGVSVEDQKAAKERIPLLLKTPAAVRWVSAEPLLGPIDFTLRWGGQDKRDSYGNLYWGTMPTLSGLGGNTLDWIVVGGESGPGARPFDIQWARDIIAQCKAADVPVFVKQLGAQPESIADHISFKGSTRKKPNGFYRHLNDKKGGDMSEWPEDLRVRQMPEVVR